MDKDELLGEIQKVFVHRDELINTIHQYSKIVLLGNGGSNAIASHVAQDYTKQLRKYALSFSDAPRLTCYLNDYGHKAFRQFLVEFTDPGTLVILISSSGNSENMVEAQLFCMESKLPYLLLTGFSVDNRMRSLCTDCGHLPMLDVHVASCDYGVVECVHQIFLHSII